MADVNTVLPFYAWLVTWRRGKKGFEKLIEASGRKFQNYAAKDL